MTSLFCSVRILRIKQVQDKTGLSRSTIYDRFNPQSPRFDECFPKPFKIGRSAIGWLESGIDAWITAKVGGQE